MKSMSIGHDAKERFGDYIKIKDKSIKTEHIDVIVKSEYYKRSASAIQTPKSYKKTVDKIDIIQKAAFDHVDHVKIPLYTKPKMIYESSRHDLLKRYDIPEVSAALPDALEVVGYDILNGRKAYNPNYDYDDVRSRAFLKGNSLQTPPFYKEQIPDNIDVYSLGKYESSQFSVRNEAIGVERPPSLEMSDKNHPITEETPRHEIKYRNGALIRAGINSELSLIKPEEGAIGAEELLSGVKTNLLSINILYDPRDSKNNKLLYLTERLLRIDRIDYRYNEVWSGLPPIVKDIDYYYLGGQPDCSSRSLLEPSPYSIFANIDSKEKYFFLEKIYYLSPRDKYGIPAPRGNVIINPEILGSESLVDFLSRAARAFGIDDKKFFPDQENFAVDAKSMLIDLKVDEAIATDESKAIEARPFNINESFVEENSDLEGRGESEMLLVKKEHAKTCYEKLKNFLICRRARV